MSISGNLRKNKQLAPLETSNYHIQTKNYAIFDYVPPETAISKRSEASRRIGRKKKLQSMSGEKDRLNMIPSSLFKILKNSCFIKITLIP